MADVLVQRKTKFNYPNTFDVCWCKTPKEFACVANSVSLMMPYVEPYVVRSVAKVSNKINLPTNLQEEVKTYLYQETQHHSQHKKFNTHLITRYPKLKKIERLAAWLFRKKLAAASDEFSLAFSASFETFAYSIARWSAKNEKELFKSANPEVARLFKWHLVEEVEHKELVYDLLKAAKVRKLTYIKACLLTIFCTLFFVLTSTLIMFKYENIFFKAASWLKLTKWAFSFAFEALPTYFLSIFSDFHPSQLVDPLQIDLWRQEIDAEKH